MGLSELELKGNILYESLRFPNPGGSIKTELKPVQAIAVGLPQVLIITTSQDSKEAWDLTERVERMHRPETANAYVIGNPGESYQNGAVPRAVQFYHKI